MTLIHLYSKGLIQSQEKKSVSSSTKKPQWSLISSQKHTHEDVGGSICFWDAARVCWNLTAKRLAMGLFSHQRRRSWQGDTQLLFCSRISFKFVFCYCIYF